MAVNFRNTVFYGIASDIKACPPQDMPEIVFSGKSNVGKSSLVNALSDNRKLARVSQTPGKTQAVVYFNVDRKLYIADLPGYGYAKTSKEKKEKFSKLAEDYFTCGRKIDLVLHLMDIRHNPSAEDVGMLEFLNNSGLNYFVVFTKCDKFSRQQLMKRLNELSKELNFSDDAVVFAVSSEKKTGLDDLRNAIEEHLFG
ncbi:MAG: YihA family ribosome biogenesis GTP-binding protein [Clostridiales bacterium]|nr:YihA family ribosome biogenesis GTP-binding protein [Clostridiales bacterium]